MREVVERIVGIPGMVVDALVSPWSFRAYPDAAPVVLPGWVWLLFFFGAVVWALLVIRFQLRFWLARLERRAERRRNRGADAALPSPGGRSGGRPAAVRRVSAAGPRAGGSSSGLSEVETRRSALRRLERERERAGGDSLEGLVGPSAYLYPYSGLYADDRDRGSDDFGSRHVRHEGGPVGGHDGAHGSGPHADHGGGHSGGGHSGGGDSGGGGGGGSD